MTFPRPPRGGRAGEAITRHKAEALSQNGSGACAMGDDHDHHHYTTSTITCQMMNDHGARAIGGGDGVGVGSPLWITCIQWLAGHQSHSPRWQGPDGRPQALAPTADGRECPHGGEHPRPPPGQQATPRRMAAQRRAPWRRPRDKPAATSRRKHHGPEPPCLQRGVSPRELPPRDLPSPAARRYPHQAQDWGMPFPRPPRRGRAGKAIKSTRRCLEPKWRRRRASCQ